MVGVSVRRPPRVNVVADFEVVLRDAVGENAHSFLLLQKIVSLNSGHGNRTSRSAREVRERERENPNCMATGAEELHSMSFSPIINTNRPRCERFSPPRALPRPEERSGERQGNAVSYRMMRSHHNRGIDDGSGNGEMGVKKENGAEEGGASDVRPCRGVAVLRCRCVGVVSKKATPTQHRMSSGAQRSKSEIRNPISLNANSRQQQRRGVLYPDPEVALPRR